MSSYTPPPHRLMTAPPGLRRALTTALACAATLAGANANAANAANAANTADAAAAAPEPGNGLSLKQGRVLLDYQSVKVAGDAAIDFMGFHILKEFAPGWAVGAGVYAPLFKGEYGGFTAFDIGLHGRYRLSSQLFANAGFSAGGGGGGRGIEQSKSLSGTGGFYKGYAGLGYEFSGFALGLNLAHMKFSRSAIAGTHANLFLELPYSYLTAPFDRHRQAVPASDARRSADEAGESMLTLVADNFQQIRPEGSYKGRLQVADLQYAHYFARDAYWYFGLGVGVGGLPLYNHVIGGAGQRLQVSPRVTLYGQLGVGSGGYAPELMNTSSGLLLYPKLSAEYALSHTLGLSVSAGYLVAPRGSSKNQTFGLALTHHIRSGSGGRAVRDAETPATYQGFRFGVFHQTEFDVRYRDLKSPRLQLVGIQADAILNERWYLPLQAAVGYTAYFGYPGYGEVLTGLGVQSLAGAGEPLQFFGQAMGGANVHGPTVKLSGGLRYALSDELVLQAEAGRAAARSSSGGRFGANSISLGLVYRFSVVQR